MTSAELLALFAAQREDWMEQASCKGQDTSKFFPKRGESKRPAQKICDVCPVKPECEEYATRTGSEHGIWAGTIRKRSSQGSRSATTPVPQDELSETSVCVPLAAAAEMS